MNRSKYVSGKFKKPKAWEPLFANGAHMDMPRVQALIKNGRDLVKHGYSKVVATGDMGRLTNNVPSAIFQFSTPDGKEKIFLSMNHARWVMAPDEFTQYLLFANGLEMFIDKYFYGREHET